MIDNIEEKTLTPNELNKREELVKKMKPSFSKWKERYGKDAKGVMYATATKMAKNMTEDSTTKVGDTVWAKHPKHSYKTLTGKVLDIDNTHTKIQHRDGSTGTYPNDNVSGDYETLHPNPYRKRAGGVAESKYPWLDAPKQPDAPKLVKDRKTGKEYDPHIEFAKVMNDPEVRAQMKRMGMGQHPKSIVKEQSVTEGVSLKQKYEDKKRADQNQVRYGKMTQAEFDKKWTQTDRPKPIVKEQSVTEGLFKKVKRGLSEESQLDELSPQTLGSYVEKATSSATKLGKQGDKAKSVEGMYSKYKKAAKRLQSVASAKNKALVSEDSVNTVDEDVDAATVKVIVDRDGHKRKVRAHRIVVGAKQDNTTDGE